MTATMLDTTLADRGIVVDKEGFLQQPSQWTEALGEEIATSLGLTMTARHWDVVKFMRNSYLETGSAPTIRTLGAKSGVPVKELYALFPRGPAKLAAKIDAFTAEIIRKNPDRVPHPAGSPEQQRRLHAFHELLREADEADWQERKAAMGK